jgi:hypothetical protein
MPYEVKNYAAEGFGNGVVSADRRNQAQLEDYARTRNDFFSLMGNRMNALANAKDNQYTQDIINQLGDTANNAILPQMNTNANGVNTFRANGQNAPVIDPRFAQQSAAKTIAQQLPLKKDYETAQTIAQTNPNQLVPYTVNGVTYEVPAAQIEQRFGTIFANKQYADNARKIQEQLFQIPQLTQLVQNYEYDVQSKRPPSISQAAYEKARADLAQANILANAYQLHAATIPNNFISTGGLFGNQRPK